MRYYVTGLSAVDALSLSRRLWELFEPAVDRAPQEIRYTYEELLDEIAKKETQVWIIVDIQDDEIVGGFTTTIATDTRFPGVTIMEIPLVAGKQMRGWLGIVLKILNAWGLEQGADIMVAYGRKGWQRVAGFEYHGDSPDGVRIMVRPIGGFH